MRITGLQSHADISESAKTETRFWRRASSVSAVGPAACLVGALVWMALTDIASVDALLNRFAAIHVFFGTGLTALAASVSQSARFAASELFAQPPKNNIFGAGVSRGVRASHHASRSGCSSQSR